MFFCHAISRRERGFTLIELIVTVAIVAILAAIALPNFREFMLRMNTTTTTNELVSALNIARAEAVKRGRAVGVVAVGGDWNNGWQVVVSKTVAGVLEATPTSPGASAADCTGSMEDGASMCLQHRGEIQGGFTLLAKADGGAAGDAVVTFSPVGALRGADAFDFSLCRPEIMKDPTQSRRIHVALSGIIEARRDTTGAPAGGCN